MTDGGDLVARLREQGVGEVDASTVTRAAYSTDASLYRVVPQVVVRPRATEEVLAALAVAREAGVPLTMRGAGTSIAGNAVGPGIVVDTARHLHRVLHLDTEARTARVQPGVVHAHLQRAAAPHGLRYGPDPSTHSRCTIGGMIGNNACGSRALGYGRTVDNLAGLTVAFGTGEVAALAAATAFADRSVAADLADLADAELARIRTGFGRFSRQVSGYALEHLLPERGRRVDRLLAGSEGTLGVVLEAEVDLVPEPVARTLLVLGYPTMADAADAVPAILAAGEGLLACEGLDARIVDLVRAAGRAVPELPRGQGWLFVEFAGADEREVAGRAAAVAAAAQPLDARVVGAAEAATLWRIRENGAGLASRSLATPAYSGWEDAAVPPERLGAWLREFDDLLAEHGLQGVPYGHFGDGCVHVRIDFDLDGDAGRRRFRDFLVASATALRAHGGSLSGEHGDGRARSELLPLMYDADALRMFAAVKRICDPDGLLNPGVLVDPDPVDAALRRERPIRETRTRLRLVDDGGSLGAAVHRCTGVGACVATGPQGPPGGGVMCPSYLATREEKDSTRGRARVLQEALDGSLVAGLRDPAVAEALDLCLACKGCASDCPTGVDLATYKAETLAQQYAGRLRPRSHYALGWLPVWLRWAAPVAPLANALLRARPLAAVAARAAGVDRRRALPALASRGSRRALVGAGPARPDPAPDVWLWADTFTTHLAPRQAAAARSLLEAAGLTVGLVGAGACCGLTWQTTGQLGRARTVVERTIEIIHPLVADGTPLLGLEPSCLAALRHDAVQLTDDPRAVEVAAATRTLAELLSASDWTPPDLHGVEVIAQPHCHHAAMLGWEADEALLRRAGASVTRIAGCCGLAGSFGMERGHYDVSVAVAETALLPAVRGRGDAVVLADGFSCRHQLADLADVPARHLAELLAGDLLE